VPSLYQISSKDLEKERRVALSIMCLEWEDWKEAVADIYNIYSLFPFVYILTSLKGLYYKGLCP